MITFLWLCLLAIFFVWAFFSLIPYRKILTRNSEKSVKWISSLKSVKWISSLKSVEWICSRWKDCSHQTKNRWAILFAGAVVVIGLVAWRMRPNAFFGTIFCLLVLFSITFFILAYFKKKFLLRAAFLCFLLAILVITGMDLKVMKDETRPILIETLTVPEEYVKQGITTETFTRILTDMINALYNVNSEMLSGKTKAGVSQAVSDSKDTKQLVIDVKYVQFSLGQVEEWVRENIYRNYQTKIRLFVFKVNGHERFHVFMEKKDEMLGSFDIDKKTEDMDGPLTETVTGIAERVGQFLGDDAVAYKCWGVVLMDMGKYSEAITQYQKAIDLDPKNSKAYNAWGAALGNLGRNDKAIRQLQKAIALDPKNSIAYYNLGGALANLKRNDEAITQYQKAIDLNPKNSMAYANLGDVLESLGRNDEAITQCQKAIELNPNDSIAYSNWGDALGNLGRNAEAITQYQKAIDIDPRDSEAYNSLGATLLQLKKYREAVTRFRQAIRLEPELTLAHENLGRALKKTGEFKEAKKELELAKKLKKVKSDESPGK